MTSCSRSKQQLIRDLGPSEAKEALKSGDKMKMETILAELAAGKFRSDDSSGHQT